MDIKQVIGVSLFVLALAGGVKAAERLDEAVDQINRAAQAAREGDLQSAIEMLQPDVANDNEHAMNAMAILLRDYGTETQQAQAALLMHRAAKLGSHEARLNLAVGDLYNPERAKSAVSVLKKLLRRPESADIAAGYLGEAYTYGLGVKSNPKKARKLLDQSVASPWAPARAHFIMGMLTQSENAQTSYNHFKTAWEQGDTRAGWHIGMVYLEGQLESKNDALAFAYVLASAEAGYWRAILSAATMYATGEGVDEDDATARSWYQQGVERNLAHAHRSYGFMLLSGEGGPVDLPLGLAHLTLAAKAGEPTASSYLGSVRQFGVTREDRIAANAIVADWVSEHGLPKLN